MQVLKCVPPTPASATYKRPSGPNFRPRGSLKPVAITLEVVTVLSGPPHTGGPSLVSLLQAANGKTSDRSAHRRKGCSVLIIVFFIPLNVSTPASGHRFNRRMPGLPGFIPFVGGHRSLFGDEWHLSTTRAFRQEIGGVRKLRFIFKQSRADHEIIYLLQQNSAEAVAAPRD